MEIYRNELANVDLKVPVTAINGTFEVSAHDDSGLLYTFQTVTAITGGYRVVLPFSLVSDDRQFEIRWAFDYDEESTQSYQTTTYVEVVTPYMTKDELILDLPEAESLSDREFKNLERKIRGVIDNYTGQSFGRYKGKKRIVGSGDEQLKLATRLVRMDDLSGANIVDSGYYTVRGDGWYVGLEAPLPDGDYVFENVIRDPDSIWKRGGFKDNVVYEIDGTWGYDSVPSDVRQAFAILCEDEICPQSEYRDRYLKSISGEGWRYEYVPEAYEGTGSVITDQLLAHYRVMAIVVI